MATWTQLAVKHEIRASDLCLQDLKPALSIPLNIDNEIVPRIYLIMNTL